MVAERVFGGRIEATVANELWRLSAGNPLLRELIVRGKRLGTGLLRRRPLATEGPAPYLRRLIDLIGIRLGALETDERRGLELVAFAEPMELRLLEALVPDVVVETLERRNLVKVSQDAIRVEVRLAHPLYGEVVRDQTPTVHVPRICGALADAMAVFGLRRSGDVLRLASWRLHDRRHHEPELFIDAARAAGRRR